MSRWTWPLVPLYRRPRPLSSIVAPQLDRSILVEEEKTPKYQADRFYPVKLGQVLKGRYQVATKLGYGADSTVWLARDLNCLRWSPGEYVAIKINALSRSSRRTPPDNERDIMRHISRVNPQHKGWPFIRKLSDSFALTGVSGNHSCLVLEALREPLWLYRRRFVGGVIPPDILKILVRMILHGLDYLHSRCHVIHTDLKPDNIMVKIEDPSIFDRDAQDEFDNPLPQKQSNGQTIYLSRNNYGPLTVPTGIIQIADFGMSVRTEPGQVHTGAIQAEIYRAPEVILNAGYTPSADIWSLGVLLWDLLEGKSLFSPAFPDNAGTYDEQSHLGHIAALIGPPPQVLLSRGQRTAMFYNSDDQFMDHGRVPGAFSFQSTINCMRGEEKLRFIRFVERMIRWDPETRSTAGELLDDPWLYEDFPQD